MNFLTKLTIAFPFTVDLFASRVNKKCRSFYARFSDPEAEIIDAFTVDWGGKHFYAFPPFALILRTLRRIINDKATGVVVVPYWPTQSWYLLSHGSLYSHHCS